MSTAILTHIRLDDTGVAWIDDTNVKVIEVALDQIAHGWSPEEIHFQHPNLSLGQIHAGLAHYHDHRDEYDAEIERQLAHVDERAARAQDSPFRRRMRAAGKLP